MGLTCPSLFPKLAPIIQVIEAISQILLNLVVVVLLHLLPITLIFVLLILLLQEELNRLEELFHLEGLEEVALLIEAPSLLLVTILYIQVWES